MRKKVSQSRINLHKNVFGQGRDSNTLFSACQTSKYQNIFEKLAAEEATLVYLIFLQLFWSPVSHIVPKKVKGGPFREFLNVHFFAKIEEGPLETFKKYAKKSLTKLKKSAQKVFGQGAGLEHTSFCLADLKITKYFQKIRSRRSYLSVSDFFEIFLVSGKSHSAEKGKSGTL